MSMQSLRRGAVRRAHHSLANLTIHRSFPKLTAFNQPHMTGMVYIYCGLANFLAFDGSPLVTQQLSAYCLRCLPQFLNTLTCAIMPNVVSTIRNRCVHAGCLNDPDSCAGFVVWVNGTNRFVRPHFLFLFYSCLQETMASCMLGRQFSQ